MPDLSLVIPVYDEEDNLRPLNERIQEALSSIEYEVIYINDGSNDKNTLEILRGFIHKI